MNEVGSSCDLVKIKMIKMEIIWIQGCVGNFPICLMFWNLILHLLRNLLCAHVQGSEDGY